MKKFYSFLVAAAMVLGATSCQQEAINEPSENAGIKSFVASMNTTRTELGANDKVMWNANDKIRIYSQENTAGVVFEGDAEEASTVATFTATEQFATSSTGYFAVYPEVKHYYNAGAADNQSVAATASYANDVWSVPVHISELQEPTAGAWDERFNVMAAYTTNNKLAFKACTALLEFTWTGVSNPMGGVSFTATGANLAGEGTLSYSTADGKISVTTEGTETFISLMGIENGETYYIPLFPGKVTGFKLTAYNASWMEEDYISYEGEFEFKAGVIYSKKAGDEPVATPSPWTMMVPNTDTQVSMTIDDNGYHVAKAVPAGDFVFYQYDMDNGEQYLSASKELGLYEWQATADDMAIAVSIPESNMFDVYLAPDASMFCVVEAGAMVPEMPKPFVPEVTTWAICGDLNSWGDTFMYTTETENLYVVKNVTMEAYSKFKVRKDSNWTTNYGGNFMYFEANKYMSVWKDGQDMLITTAGTYDIYFKYISSNEGKLYVVTAGEDYTTAVEQIAEGPQPNPTNVVFGLCGAHNNWGTNDTEMALDATLNAYVAKNAKLTGEFKVRGNKTWGAYNYGAASNGTVTVGKGIQVSNGSNTNLKVTSGTYDVYFSYNKNMVWVMKVGEVPADL